MKQEVESILVVDRYLICKLFEKKQDQITLCRRYLTRKVEKALNKRNKDNSKSIFDLFTF